MDAANLTQITELLLIAVAVAVTVKYIRLPYTVALVLVGLVVGFTHFFDSFHLSKDVILFVFLPPLLFEGTLNMDLAKLRDHGWYVGVLAFLGTLVSTLALGLIVHFALGLALPLALLLGAIVTPTDPVSVLAIFKEHGVTKGLSTIVEGESVFNDGIGVVIYLILLQFIGGQEMTVFSAIKLFAWEVFAGALIGIAAGYITHLVLGRIDDHLIEVLISVILAYGSYLLAERFHCSGVVAVVCAGLIIGNYGKIFSMSPRTRITLSRFWEVIGFAANSLLFLLIGIDLDSGALMGAIGVVACVFASMVLVRSVTSYALTSTVSAVGKLKIPWKWRHVINWGGLRGSIPIALVLGLPPSIAMRDQMVVIVFGVVFLSLMIQGLTIKPLLKKLGLIGGSAHENDYEKALSARLAAKAALTELEQLHEAGEISQQIYQDMKADLVIQDERHSGVMHDLMDKHKDLQTSVAGKINRRLCYARLTALRTAFFKGVISEETLSEVSEEIEAQLDESSEGH